MIKPPWAFAGIALMGAAGAVGAVIVASSGGEEDAVYQTGPASPLETATPLSSEEAALQLPGSTDSLPEALPPPADGYVWWEIPPNEDYGFVGYAVQAPVDWPANGIGGNPTVFGPLGASELSPSLLAMVTPIALGYDHPVLFNLPMQGTTCGEGLPRDRASVDAPDERSTSFAADVYSWKVYLFTCTERLTSVQVAAGETPTPFDVRGAEVKDGDFIFSVTAFEPVGSAAAKAAFEQALDSFRRRVPRKPPPLAPQDLPAPIDGYTWFVAPENEVWIALFAVQVPANWARSYGNFSPYSEPAELPYARAPALSFEASVVQPTVPDSQLWFHYPLVSYEYQREGKTCSGDLTAEGPVPSSQHATSRYKWDLYRYRCHHVEPCCPPGVDYDVRVAVTTVENVIFSIMALETPGSGETETILTNALDSFAVR